MKAYSWTYRWATGGSEIHGGLAITFGTSRDEGRAGERLRRVCNYCRPVVIKQLNAEDAYRSSMVRMRFTPGDIPTDEFLVNYESYCASLPPSNPAHGATEGWGQEGIPPSNQEQGQSQNWGRLPRHCTRCSLARTPPKSQCPTN